MLLVIAGEGGEVWGGGGGREGEGGLYQGLLGRVKASPKLGFEDLWKGSGNQSTNE